MQKQIVKMLSLWLCISFYCPSIALAGASPALYPINVTSREIANRIVESHVRGHRVLVDQPEEFGANDLAPTPPEYLAIAYSSCIVSTLRFIALMEELDVENIEVHLAGEIDFSKAMGIPTTHRAGLPEIDITISFNSAMSPSEQQQFVDKAMELGAVLDNVHNETRVSYKITN